MVLNRIYLYPRWLRAWHILNAFAIVTLIITGFSMHFTHEGSNLVTFKNAVITHNIAGLVLTFLYLLFFISNLFSDNRRHYHVFLKGLYKKLKKQITYYMSGMFKGQEAPFPTSIDQKFNPVQQVTYVTVMYIVVPLVIITGLFMLYPESIAAKVFGVNGMLLVALLHLLAAFVVTLFLFIHIYFATIGHKINSHFKSIINGYHELDE